MRYRFVAPLLACVALVGACASDAPDASARSDTTTTTTTAAPRTAPFSPGGARAGLDVIRTALDGPLVVRRVVLYESYMFAEVRDPANPEHLDEYTVRDGALIGVEPIQLTGDDKALADLYAAEAVDWDAIGALAASGGAPLDVEGRATHVVVALDSSSRRRGVLATGYVSGPRRAGRWTADADGVVIETHID